MDAKAKPTTLAVTQARPKPIDEAGISFIDSIICRRQIKHAATVQINIPGVKMNMAVARLRQSQAAVLYPLVLPSQAYKLINTIGQKNIMLADACRALITNSGKLAKIRVENKPIDRPNQLVANL